MGVFLLLLFVFWGCGDFFHPETPGEKTSGQTPEETPAVPSGVSVTVLSDNAAAVSWNPVSGATAYQVYYGTKADADSYAAASNSPHIIGGLLSGTTYYFRVRAGNSAGWSADSEAVNAKTSSSGAAGTITGVTVAPENPQVKKGGTQQFTATVTGTGSLSQIVTWTVEGGAEGTSIDATGLLKIAPDETALTVTVRAVSAQDTGKSGTAAVTVTADSPPPSTPTGDGTLAGSLESIGASPVSGSVYNFVLAPGDETMDPKTLDFDGVKVTINIDGRGRTVTLKSAGSLLSVGNGVTLTIKNLTLKGRENNSGFSNTRSLLVVNTGGVLELHEGSLVTGNSSSSSDYSGGGGVYVRGGTFTMEVDSTVSGNRAYYSSSTGGGVKVAAGTFTKRGGIIYGDTNTTHTADSTENTALNGDGHAVYLYNGKKRNSTAGTAVKLYAKRSDSGGTTSWTYNDTSAGGVGNTTANWE
jgi:hypothetical protein